MKFKGLFSQRIFSMLAYYIPYIDLLNMQIPIIQRGHPFLVRLVLPNFIVDSMEFCQQVPFLSLVYLLLTYGIFIRYKIPEDRLIRFNIMSSIILMSFQGIFYELFGYYTTFFCKTPGDAAEVALVTFILWLYIFIPCFIRGARGEYVSNIFIREAIEVHLGRDGPDFTWWDRKKKKRRRPRKPKK
uniref:hypothetical protein n=1 Tax=Microzonia abyssicola TaxID=217214 RepID=UPI002E76C22A|nr:hypothetical protein V2497_pgp082 [Syringoderma abyssicola]WAM65007.1 hypothetical protein [Syringoderma abyssicola]